MAHEGPSHRGLLADEALQGILPQGGDDADGHLLFHHLIVNSHRVKQAHGVRRLLHLNDLGGADHPLQIADAAVVPVFGLLGAFIFVVLAEIPEGPGGLHFLDQLGTQFPDPVVDLLLHFADIDLRQLIVHDDSPIPVSLISHAV